MDDQWNNRDPVNSNNQVITNLGLERPPLCPQADLGVTVVASSPTMQHNTLYTYTVTHTNNGPSAADNSRVIDVLGISQALSYTGYSVTCTASG